MAEFKLEKELRQQTIWFIRRYPLMLTEYKNAIWKTKVADGMPHGSGVSDTTAQEAMIRCKYADDLKAIDNALMRVPEAYRKGVIDSILYKIPYPYYAATSTWKRWRRRFIYFVAYEKGWTND